MSVIWIPYQAPAATGNPSLIAAIQNLGLTSGLKICLDAGDANSYTSGTKWLDTSGNGFDFHFGDGVNAGTRPTFNGTPGGLSANEYFTSSGTNYFTYDSTAEPWMQTLHKDGAVLSAFAIWRATSPLSSSAFSGFTNWTGMGGGAVWLPYSASGGGPRFASFITSIQTAANIVSTTLPVANAWNIQGFSLNENTGANGAVWNVNGTATTHSSTYTAPATNDPTVFRLASSTTSGNSNAFPVGVRFACLAIWQGTALSSTQLEDLRNAMRGRYGL